MDEDLRPEVDEGDEEWLGEMLRSFTETEGVEMDATGMERRRKRSEAVLKELFPE